MKKIVCVLIIMILLSGCANNKEKTPEVLPIDTATVYSLIEEDNIFIIDVREETEYKTGHLKNAYNIPVGTIDSIDIEKFPLDSKIIVYCQSGVRSRIAADKLVDIGYLKIYNMGGINNWKYELISD